MISFPAPYHFKIGTVSQAAEEGDIYIHKTFSSYSYTHTIQPVEVMSHHRRKLQYTNVNRVYTYRCIVKQELEHACSRDYPQHEGSQIRYAQVGAYVLKVHQ